MRRINIGLIGAGVVGSALVSQLDLKYDRIKMEFDIDIRVNKILVRDLSTKRDIPSKSILYSDDDTQKLQKAFLLLL